MYSSALNLYTYRSTIALHHWLRTLRHTYKVFFRNMLKDGICKEIVKHAQDIVWTVSLCSSSPFSSCFFFKTRSLYVAQVILKLTLKVMLAWTPRYSPVSSSQMLDLNTWMFLSVVKIKPLLNGTHCWRSCLFANIKFTRNPVHIECNCLWDKTKNK